MSEIRFKYPKGENRVDFERRLLGTIGDKIAYNQVSFLKVNDFTGDINRHAWQVMKTCEGNYSKIISNSPKVMDFVYNFYDFVHIKANALFLVECNISSAIISVLEQAAIGAKKDIERDFFIEAASEAEYLGALELHSSISHYVKAVSSDKNLKLITGMVNRISTRIKEIKKWD